MKIGLGVLELPSKRNRYQSSFNVQLEHSRNRLLHFSDAKEVFETAKSGPEPFGHSAATLRYDCAHEWICSRGRCHIPVERIDFEGETPLVRKKEGVLEVLNIHCFVGLQFHHKR